MPILSVFSSLICPATWRPFRRRNISLTWNKTQTWGKIATVCVPLENRRSSSCACIQKVGKISAGWQFNWKKKCTKHVNPEDNGKFDARCFFFAVLHNVRLVFKLLLSELQSSHMFPRNIPQTCWIWNSTFSFTTRMVSWMFNAYSITLKRAASIKNWNGNILLEW